MCQNVINKIHYQVFKSLFFIIYFIYSILYIIYYMLYVIIIPKILLSKDITFPMQRNLVIPDAAVISSLESLTYI